LWHRPSKAAKNPECETQVHQRKTKVVVPKELIPKGFSERDVQNLDLASRPYLSRNLKKTSDALSSKRQETFRPWKPLVQRGTKYETADAGLYFKILASKHFDLKKIKNEHKKLTFKCLLITLDHHQQAFKAWFEQWELGLKTKREICKILRYHIFRCDQRYDGINIACSRVLRAQLACFRTIAGSSTLPD
jgi:hypothetical protein